MFFFLYLSIKNAAFKFFFKEFICMFKNREVGEALFIIVFFLLPVFIIIWLSKNWKNIHVIK
jgi:hypothetical protein